MISKHPIIFLLSKMMQRNWITCKIYELHLQYWDQDNLDCKEERFLRMLLQLSFVLSFLISCQTELKELIDWMRIKLYLLSKVCNLWLFSKILQFVQSKCQDCCWLQSNIHLIKWNRFESFNTMPSNTKGKSHEVLPKLSIKVTGYD